MWRHVYRDVAKWGATHRHMKRIIRRMLAGIRYDSVLDVGCGPGDNLEILSRDRPLESVVGADISAFALQQARAAHHAQFFSLDIERDRLEGAWDLVTSFLLLEHLEDDVAALRNMRAMTRKYLLLSTIAGDYARYRRWDARVGHVRNYAVGELERKLEHVGFHVESAVYWGFPFYAPLTRALQNWADPTMGGRPLIHPFGRVFSELAYLLYFLNSSRRGDVLVVLARAADPRYRG
jgi:SAM-dependent methyltransferase